VFSDIHTYLHKLMKNEHIDDSRLKKVFKFAITKSQGQNNKYVMLSPSFILSQCNEQILEREYKQDQINNSLLETRSYLDSSLEKAEYENIHRNPYHYIYTTEGVRVNDFAKIPEDVQICLLVNKYDLNYVEKLKRYTSVALKNSISTKNNSNKTGIISQMNDWYQTNMNEWESATKRTITQDNMKYMWE